MVVAVVALEVLVLTLVTIALAHAAFKLMQAIGLKLQDLPFPFNQLAGPVQGLAQVISNALGKLEQGIDHLIGASWHLLASFLDHQWRHLVWSAHLFAGYGEWLWRLTHSHAVTKHLVNGLVGGAHAFGSAVKTLEKEFHGIEHRVKTLEHEIAKGIGNDVRVHVKALEQELTGIEKGVIPNLRAGIKTAEGEVTQLENFIKAIPGTRYLDWAAGIVTAALGLEIFRLLKCPSLLSSAKNRRCGLWNGLEDLLGLFIDALVLANICDAIPWLEKGFGEVEGLIVPIISDSANALCARRPKGYVLPSVPSGPRPPTQTLGPFGS